MQREQRVAGDRGVDGRPHAAARSPPARRSAHARPSVAPTLIHRKYRPARIHASGRSRPAGAEQREHGPAAPRARRLHHRRPHDERHVGHVDVAARGEEREVEARQQQQRGDRADQRRERDPAEAVDPPHQPQVGGERHRHPDAVADLPQQRQQRARRDRQRVLGGDAEALEERGLRVEHLAAPQQRVVRVVVRVRGIDQEADEEARAEHAEGDLRDGVESTSRSRAAIPDRLGRFRSVALSMNP